MSNSMSNSMSMSTSSTTAIPAKPLGPPIPLPGGSLIQARTLPDLYGSVDSLNRWCDVEPLPGVTGESPHDDGSAIQRREDKMRLIRVLLSSSGWNDVGALFDKDPTSNKVLWFSGPPIDIDQPERPMHSARYLGWLARRKVGVVDRGSISTSGEAGSGTTPTVSLGEVGLEEGGLWGREGEVEDLLYG